MLNRAKDYYKKDKERLREQARALLVWCLKSTNNRATVDKLSFDPNIVLIFSNTCYNDNVYPN